MIRQIDGEKDPRCLLLVFRFVPFVTKLFNVDNCYEVRTRALLPLLHHHRFLSRFADRKCDNYRVLRTEDDDDRGEIVQWQTMLAQCDSIGIPSNGIGTERGYCAVSERWLEFTAKHHRYL